MMLDTPNLKKCCCCVPLRPGLIAWGYIKLIMSLLGTILFGIVFGLQTKDVVTLPARILNISGYMMFSSLSVFLFFLMDLCFIIVFLIGAHMKNTKLLIIYYVYSIAELCIYSMVLSWLQEIIIANEFGLDFKEMGGFTILIFELIAYLIVFLILGINIYIIFLTSSEINKLRDDSKSLASEDSTDDVEQGVDSSRRKDSSES